MNGNWLASCSQNVWLEMTGSDPNLHIVEIIAAHLGELCSDVVFVGGCAAGLLLTQMRSESIRVTRDVDVIASVATLGDYHKLEDQLRAKGFQNDLSTHAPICRWAHSAEGGLPVLLDLMPSNPEVLGFANRWYPHAIKTAQSFKLPSGRDIQLIAAPAFIATKLEALKGRGSDAQGMPDFLGSHDLEDIISVVDRRPQLLPEARNADQELKAYLAEEFKRLFAFPDFETTLAGHLPPDAASQARLSTLRQKLKAMAELA